MSSSSFAATIELRPATSRRALTLLFWLHLIPLALLVFAMPPGLPMLALGAAMGLSWWLLRRHAVFGFGPRALTRLIWHGEGGWTLEDTRGRQTPAALLPQSLCLPALIVLRFRSTQGRLMTRVLLGDELPEESQRRLRARLNAWRPQGERHVS